MREAAERVLMAETLEEKLWLPPVDATDVAPGKAIATPLGPGRPLFLQELGSLFVRFAAGCLASSVPDWKRR